MMGRKSILAYGNMGIGIVLGLLATILTAKIMGPGPLGQVTTALGFLGLLFFITDLGMGQAHIKRVSEGRDPGDCFATFAAFKIVSTLLFVVIAALGLWVYLVVLGKGLESTTLPVLLAILAYFVAKSLQEIGQSSFDARLETARSQLTTFLDTLVRVAFTIVAVLVYQAVFHGAGPLLGSVPGPLLWIRERPGLALALATAAGAAAAAAASLYMLFRVLERGRFRWELLKDYATFAFPLFLVSAVTIISASIDAATLGFFLSEHEAGIFGGIRRIVGVLGNIAVPVAILLFPTMSSLAASGDHAAIKRTMDRSIRYLSMLILPLCAFTAVFATPLIRIFLADTFVSGALPLAVFCGYVVLVTLASPHVNLVLGMGRSDVAARIGLGSAVTVIVLNLVLVPDDIRSLGIPLAGLGILGTALSTLASGVVFYVGSRYASHRVAGYREEAHVWRHVVAAAAMCLALLAVDAWALPFTRWFDVLLYAPLGATVYFLALFLLRELTPEDVRFVRESVHPLEMLRYLKAELTHRRR